MRIINSIKEAQAKANTALLTAALSIQSPFWSKSTDGRHVHNVSIYGTPFCPNRTGCMLVGIYKSQEIDTSVLARNKMKNYSAFRDFGPMAFWQEKMKNYYAFGGIWTHEYEYNATWVHPLRPLGHECYNSSPTTHTTQTLGYDPNMLYLCTSEQWMTLQHSTNAIISTKHEQTQHFYGWITIRIPTFRGVLLGLKLIVPNSRYLRSSYLLDFCSHHFLFLSLALAGAENTRIPC